MIQNVPVSPAAALIEKLVVGLLRDILAESPGEGVIVPEGVTVPVASAVFEVGLKISKVPEI
nr:hypothetical protein [Bacillus cereus]